MNPLRWLWIYKNPLIVLLVPVILLPLPLYIGTSEAKCGYVLITMAIYWTTEVLPLAVTSLLPIVMLPLLGVTKAKDVAANYIKDISLVLVGGLAVAIAIEKCNLHRRIALSVLKLVGAKPVWLMAGFMLPTWFLSMWISNTATTSMMLPVVEAVLQELEGAKVRKDQDTDKDKDSITKEPEVVGLDNVAFTEESGKERSNDVQMKEIQDGNLMKLNGPTDSHVPETESASVDLRPEVAAPEGEESPAFQRMCKAFTLCVCYAANAGGTATLTGTGPNLILKGQVDDLWAAKGLPSPITFTSWMIWGLPCSAILVVLTWLWLLLIFFGPRKMFQCCVKGDKEREAAVKKVIRDQYDSLGPIRFEELAVVFFFVLLVLLWFFRQPEFIPGWSSAFPAGYTADAVPAIFVAVCLYVFPSRPPWRLGNDNDPHAPAPPLMNWKHFQANMPWSIVLLLGGGFALANAAQVSGLSKWIADLLSFVKELPGFVMVFLLCFLVAMLTEVTSNSATATILLPIMYALAVQIGKNPLYLMLPVTIATSFAYMLPVATPPNAIAFSFGRIRVFDMVKAGSFLNVLAVLVVTVGAHTWGMAFFNFDKMPWPTNNTVPINTTASP